MGVRQARGFGHLEAIWTLWDELADFPAAQIDAAQLHLMTTLGAWLAADDVVWVGGVCLAHGARARRDPQHGWRARAVRHLAQRPALAAGAGRAMREQDTDPGMTTCAITATAGRFRVHRLRDGFVDFQAFRRTAHFKALYQAAGIVDRIWTAFPVNKDAESYFLFDLYDTRRRFSARDAALAGEALRGIKWFHRNLMLSHGLVLADTPLSPVLRSVLALLLTERSEKQIAGELGLTPGTAHQYAAELYRKLGVKGRAGLTGLWLGRPPPADQPPTDQ